jgi:hypothetical protein
MYITRIGRPASTKSSPCNNPINSYTREVCEETKLDLFTTHLLVDSNGKGPKAPLWMHLSKHSDLCDGHFVYSSDEYDE